MKRKPKIAPVKVPRKWDRGLYATAFRDGFAAGLADKIREHASTIVLGQLAAKLAELAPGLPLGASGTLGMFGIDSIAEPIARALTDGDPELVAELAVVGTRGIKIAAPPRKRGRLAGPFRVVEPSSSLATVREACPAESCGVLLDVPAEHFAGYCGACGIGIGRDSAGAPLHLFGRTTDDPPFPSFPPAPSLDGYHVDDGFPRPARPAPSSSPAINRCPGCGRSTLWVRPPGDRLDYCVECGLASGVSDGMRIVFHDRPRRPIPELRAILERLGVRAVHSAASYPFADEWREGLPAIQVCPVCGWRSDLPHFNRYGTCAGCGAEVFFRPEYLSAVPAPSSSPANCPRCSTVLESQTEGTTVYRSCPRCGWNDGPDAPRVPAPSSSPAWTCPACGDPWCPGCGSTPPAPCELHPICPGCATVLHPPPNWIVGRCPACGLRVERDPSGCAVAVSASSSPPSPSSSPTCPKCGAALDASPDLRGGRSDCRNCGWKASDNSAYRPGVEAPPDPVVAAALDAARKGDNPLGCSGYGMPQGFARLPQDEADRIAAALDAGADGAELAAALVGPTPGEAAIAATGGKLAPAAARALDELADGRSSTAAADGAAAAAARSDAAFAATPAGGAFDTYRRRIARAPGLRALECEIDRCRIERERADGGKDPTHRETPPTVGGKRGARKARKG